jgi:hypothetical protein
MSADVPQRSGGMSRRASRRRRRSGTNQLYDVWFAACIAQLLLASQHGGVLLLASPTCQHVPKSALDSARYQQVINDSRDLLRLPPFRLQRH